MLDPIGNRVIIETVKEETRTIGGLIIPKVTNERYTSGKVIATGRGKYCSDGSMIPMSIKVGDTVTFDKAAGREYGTSMRIMFEDEVWGVNV